MVSPQVGFMMPFRVAAAANQTTPTNLNIKQNNKQAKGRRGRVSERPRGTKTVTKTCPWGLGMSVPSVLRQVLSNKIYHYLAW